MARPSNRYARAQARARYRKPKRRSSSMLWNVAIGVIVVAGIAAIVVSRSGSGGATAPEIGAHWHAQLSVYVCGVEQPPAPDTPGGVHSHAADPFIHIHPNSSAEAGDRATVERFIEAGNWELDEDSFELWFGAQRNGDPCPDGQPGTVRWALNGEEQSGNLADYKPDDGDEIVLAFLPEGQEIPAAPSAVPTQD